ncbi:MAG TPA: hypothetical protein VIL85_04570 [Thermomicrobiales bacterium]
MDKRAPMPAAPMKYAADGSVAWGEMWDSFCALALDGGPPHRATLLEGDTAADPASNGYRFAVAEITRGVAAVSGLPLAPAATGWLAIECHSAGMAHWLAEAIIEENVAARARGAQLLVPVGADYTLTGEIKNVITAVAKTTHYWREHLPPEVKQTLEWQARLGGLRQRVAGWLGRSAATGGG